jgi:ATP/maltotriose-dependent transcriptional regulator MalT
VALYNLGEVAAYEGNPDAAAAFHERSIELASARQDGFRTVPLRLLGQLAIDLGDLARARALLAESLLVARDWGKAGWGVAPALVNLAELAVAEGQPERALRLAGAAAGLREARQARLQPTESARAEARVGSARRTLGDLAATKAWSEGKSMTLDEAVDYALQAPRRQRSATPT